MHVPGRGGTAFGAQAAVNTEILVFKHQAARLGKGLGSIKRLIGIDGGSRKPLSHFSFVAIATLARLGVTCLWLNPIHPTPNRDDGYDVSDYYGVHPKVGTLGEFVMKALKRDAGVRSWGGKASVTGAVGLLDADGDGRLDGFVLKPVIISSAWRTSFVKV